MDGRLRVGVGVREGNYGEFCRRSWKEEMGFELGWQKEFACISDRGQAEERKGSTGGKGRAGYSLLPGVQGARYRDEDKLARYSSCERNGCWKRAGEGRMLELLDLLLEPTHVRAQRAPAVEGREETQDRGFLFAMGSGLKSCF